MGHIAEAELVLCSEGSMCAVVTRDGVAPPGSKAISRTKSCRRTLGDPAGAAGAVMTWAGVGRKAKPERPAVPGWKSDWLVVPRKPPKVTRWWREGANVWGDGDAPGRDRTLRRSLPIPSGGRNGGAPARYPHEEPDAGKLHVRICEGESQQWLIYSTAGKPANKDAPASAEPVEPRAGAEGNTVEADTGRTPSRESVSHGLDRVRQTAREKRTERFTALLHHVDVERLRAAYVALRRDAAPGVDGMTWREYGQDLERRLGDLHG